jgi:hypothetical protein
MTPPTRPFVLRGLLALSVALASPVAPLAQPRALALGTPLAVSGQQFGLVNTVRELGSESLLLADPLSGDLWLLPPTLRDGIKLGREGSGPGEYRQPDAVWPLRGDTTLLVDLGNARLSVLDARGAFVRSVPMILGQFTPGAGGPPASIMPRGTDALGRVYFQGSPMGPRGLADSVDVMRYDLGAKDGSPAAVARVKAPDFARSESGSENAREVRIRPVPLAGGDGWAVAGSGTIAVARVGQYRVDWRDPNGTQRAGPAIAHDRVRVGTAEKNEWVTQQQLTGGVGMEVEDRNGEVSVSFARNRPGRGGPSTEGLAWPEYKPPFDNASLVVDRSGRVWVQRHLPAGRPPQYDVVGPDGNLLATVSFPVRRRLVGFGARGLFVTATDDDGLQRVELYAVPVR